MSAHLPNAFTSPPGQWRYRVPETGQHTPRFPDYNSLHEWLKAHYRANGYQLPADLSQRVEAYICERESGYCVEDEPRLPEARHREPWSLAHTFHIVLQGTRTLASWIAGGREFVAPEHADTRAGICTTCRYNEEPEGCTGCNMPTLRAAVEAVAGNRTTKHHAHLRSCRICHCGLRAKVWLPHSILWRHMPEEQRAALPATCWLVREAATEASLSTSPGELQPASNP